MNSNSKAIAIFDFLAQAGSSELTIHKNDILNVVNVDIGEGWWEGVNARGERGLFPASYVKLVESNEDANKHESIRPYSQSSQSKVQVESTSQSANNEEPDWPDEDWDDEDDSGDNATDYQGSKRGFLMGASYYGATSTATGTAPFSGGVNPLQTDLNIATGNLSLSDNRNSHVSGVGAQAAANVAAKPLKNLNRFSNFVKSGLESYILETNTIDVPLESIVHIQNDPELGIVWKPNLNPYTCAVTKHRKESKMKGFKTFISYDITPSVNNIIVRRRYKHFDWLMQRMEEKFIVTPLPPLPEKQIAGRFQEDFVEHRRNLLQLWVNYITRHPILSQCDVWWHFMTCSTDDMKGWKFGKRKAEKDELVGANFFHSIEIDPNAGPLDPIKTTKQLDNFQRFVSKFDDSVKHMFTTTVDQSKKFSTGYAKDYKKLSESIKELSSAFQSGTAWRNSLGLNEAIRQTSAAYEDISRLHEEEPKYDFEPMADMLHQYRGLLSSWPEILQLHRNAVNRRSELERLSEEGKISEADVSRVNQRTNVITYATLAEINHFHNERLVDFKQMMQVFLTAQINFHSDILGKLQSALNKVNNA